MTPTWRISIDFDALTDDARRWEEVGDSVAEMKHSLSQLPARPSAFSFAGWGLSARYDTIRDTLISTLGKGATEVRGIADTLRDIRRQYEADEAQITDELRRLWRPAE